MSKPIWEPSAKRVAQSNLAHFMAVVQRNWGVETTSYSQLYEFSIDQPEKFWSTVWEFCGVISQVRGEIVVRDKYKLPGAVWFPEARLNFAENLLRRRDDSNAILALNEINSQVRRLSYKELYNLVSKVAQALTAVGVSPGDRVAGLLPNIPEAVIAMLATTAIGAIWCACSPDFGAAAVLDRFSQVGPKVLFVANGYFYNGKKFDTLDKVRKISAELPSVVKLVLVNNLGNLASTVELTRVVTWDELIDPFHEDEIDFPQFPFDHPVFILYSSGTTGPPKCIIHGAGGSLLENLKGQVLQFDVKRGDCVFWWTTTGWVVWNLMLFTLACEAAVILYEGSPLYPSASRILEIAAKHGATFVRLSPKFIEEMAKENIEVEKSHDLEQLKTITAAGGPFMSEGYEYIYNKVKRDVHLASPAGGTDPFASLVSGNPIGPVWPGEIQVRGLGIKVEVFDEHGASIKEKQGELVVTQAFPSMPLGFWNDTSCETFLNSYFSVYQNTWCQGDWAKLTSRGGVIIYGRSDATLNARGIRIGTAEIYSQLAKIQEVRESVAVGQEWYGDSRVILFVQLRPGLTLDGDLVAQIKRRIRDNLSPRHVPEKIGQVNDIPRTKTGKISELAVREAIHGREVKNKSALSNVDSLSEFSPKTLPNLMD